MSDTDDDVVAQLRRALSVDHLGESRTAHPVPSAPSEPAPPSGPDPTSVDTPRRAPVGLAALDIADEILGFVPTYATSTKRVRCGLRRDGAVYSIPEAGLVLGRRAASGVLVIDDRHVSREHARVVDIDGTLQIVDLGSSNGTAVRRGDRRIEVGPSAIALEPGDRVVTVNDVELVDVVEEPAP